MRYLCILLVHSIIAALWLLKERCLHYIKIALCELIVGFQLLLIIMWFLALWAFAPSLWFQGLFASLRPPTDPTRRVTAGRQVLP